MTPRFWLLQLVAATLLSVAWWAGALGPLFFPAGVALSANSAMSFAIAFGALIGIGFLGMPTGWTFRGTDKWEWVRRISRLLPIAGLLGTVVGLKIASGGLVAGNAEFADLGIEIALNTTIIGLCGSVWLRTNRWLLA
jgi:hypothetical protein